MIADIPIVLKIVIPYALGRNISLPNTDTSLPSRNISYPNRNTILPGQRYSMSTPFPNRDISFRNRKKVDRLTDR